MSVTNSNIFMRMKLSQDFLKMTIKVLILLILFVSMFIISMFLYSAKYWPDIYNYLNANITIKRISTISELDLQVRLVDAGYTTETYTTTDADYIEMSTVHVEKLPTEYDFDIDEFMKEELRIKTDKRQVEMEEIRVYDDLLNNNVFVDYVFFQDPIEMNFTSSDDNISKTVVTKHMLDENTMKTTETDLNIVLEDLYDIDDINHKIVKRTAKVDDSNQEEIYTRPVFDHTTTKQGYLVDYNFAFELKDYDEQKPLTEDIADVSKLTTRSLDVEFVTKMPNEVDKTFQAICLGDMMCQSFTRAVFPWVAAVFIKNDTENSQYHYYCDGALLSDAVILTGGRCLQMNNESVTPANVLVFLGKGNLQSMAGTEKLYRIKEINMHPNFTVNEGNGEVFNDLALLILQETAIFSFNVQAACIHYNETDALEESATTAWGPSGHLLPIFFEKEKSDICIDKNENIFCATYGLNVALCPSYGGIFASKRRNRWCIEGLFYGNPADRGLCFNRNVLFTSLHNYMNWIDDIIVSKYILRRRDTVDSDAAHSID